MHTRAMPSPTVTTATPSTPTVSLRKKLGLPLPELLLNFASLNATAVLHSLRCGGLKNTSAMLRSHGWAALACDR